jgi:hypothetical protein
MKEKLEKLIPEGNLAVYHHLLKAPLDFGTTKSLLTGFKIVDEIKERLDTLRNRGFIRERDANFIFERLTDSICENENTGKLIANKKLLKRRGNQRDWNLSLFIYLTISDLKTYTRKPHYGAVADHLTGLEIYGRNGEPLTAKAVEEIYRSITEKDVRFLLDMLYAAHYGKDLLPRMKLIWEYSRSGVLDPAYADCLKDEFIPWELLREYDELGFLGLGCCDVGRSITDPSCNPFR